MTATETFTITAHNAAQAEYLVRSRAEQRGVDIERVEVSQAGPDSWDVTVIAKDSARTRAAALADDTAVFRLDTLTERNPGHG